MCREACCGMTVFWVSSLLFLADSKSATRSRVRRAKIGRSPEHRTRQDEESALYDFDEGAAGHIEHYANSEDSVAHCAVIHFKKTSDESERKSEANTVTTIYPKDTDHGNLIWQCAKTREHNDFEQA